MLFFGENSLGHRDESRRVMIVHSEGSFARSRATADSYFITFSRSMSIEIWKNYIGSKSLALVVWVTQMTGCYYSGQNINSIRPHGETEIWWAY